MSYSYISKKLRQQIAQQAQYRCGYCLSPEILTGAAMEIDHLVPETRGGLTQEDNLWLACHTCNKLKGDKSSALNPETQKAVSIFNPRIQI